MNDRNSQAVLDATDKSYKIVAFDWDGTAVTDRNADASKITKKLEELMSLGCLVVVITGTHNGNVEKQFCDLIERSWLKQRLYLCVNRGSQVFTYDSGGKRVCRYERVATKRENAIMDNIANTVRDWLKTQYGYEVDILFDRVNRRKIDLIPEPEWRDPKKENICELLDAVNDRMVRVGLENGIKRTIDKIEELAREQGINVKITSDVKHVEFGLTDKSDSVRYILDYIAKPANISAKEILFVGDEFGDIHGFEGSDCKMIVPEAFGATYVSVGREPNGPPKDVLHYDRGPDGFFEIINRLIDGCRESGLVHDWIIEETKYHPGREAIGGTHFVTGNGYMGVRGSFEELGTPELQGLFVAGMFAEIVPPDYIITDTHFKKRFVIDEDKLTRNDSRNSIVNLPDVLSIRIFINGKLFRMWDGELLEYHRWLDMCNSCMHRTVRWDNGEGQISRIHFERFCSMVDEHMMYLRCSITPENYSGTVRIESGIDAGVNSACKAKFSDADEDGLTVETSVSDCPYTVCQTIRNQIYINDEPVSVEWGKSEFWARVGRSVDLDVELGNTYRLEKAISVFTSRDPKAKDIKSQTETLAERAHASGYSACFADHKKNWDGIWANSDVEIEGDEESQRLMRFALYHLVIAAPWKDSTVSIGARALSGQGYDGLVFWETDIYMEPFYSWTFPECARNHYMYRYLTLDGARKNAIDNGFTGAKYPFIGAVSGREQAPRYVVAGHSQVHIVPDVAHSINRYLQVTGDEKYLCENGAEVIFECARYMAQQVFHNADTDCYEIRGIGGPDEYHPLVDNNAYTNYMSARLFENASRTYESLKSLDPDRLLGIVSKIDLLESEVKCWSEIAAKMYFCVDDITGLIEQHQGYFKLNDEWDEVGDRDGGPSAEYHMCKGIKQPDVLMLLALFPEAFGHKHLMANWDYYERLVQHGSSLSPSIHSLVAAKLGLVQKAREYFLMSGRFVFTDFNGEAHRGIHIGNLAGMWLAAVFGFAGMQTDNNTISFMPHLPQQWKSLAFRLVYQGNKFKVAVAPGSVNIIADENNKSGVDFAFGDRRVTLQAGETRML